MSPLRRTVILVGAGHVHLYVIAHAEALIARGARVVFIDPGEFWYSGLATWMHDVGVKNTLTATAGVSAPPVTAMPPNFANRMSTRDDRSKSGQNFRLDGTRDGHLGSRRPDRPFV